MRSLNVLAGFPADSQQVASSAQRAALSSLQKDYVRTTKSCGRLQPERAFHELIRAKSGYADDAASGGFAVYRRDAVKLPKQSAGAHRLDHMLPSELRLAYETGEGFFLATRSSLLLFLRVDERWIRYSAEKVIAMENS